MEEVEKAWTPTARLQRSRGRYEQQDQTGQPLLRVLRNYSLDLILGCFLLRDESCLWMMRWIRLPVPSIRSTAKPGELLLRHVACE